MQVKWKGRMKNSRFPSIFRFIAKTVQDTAIYYSRPLASRMWSIGRRHFQCPWTT